MTFVIAFIIILLLGIAFYVFLPGATIGSKILGIAILIVMLGLGFRGSYIYLKMRKPEEIPNLWTGLGILFTFISFVIAFSSGDMDIHALIPKISAAFTTSIAGLIYSKIAIFF